MIVTIDLDIKAGDVWRNAQDYKLIILDLGERELWAEWENGNKGHFSYDKFILSRYELYSRP